MKKLLLIFLFLTTVIFAKAQTRLQVQAGPSVSLRPVNRDSLFSAKKNAFHLQGRLINYAGHMGLGLTIGYFQQNVSSDTIKIPRFPALNGIDTFTVEGGSLEVVYFLAGPEFCISCSKKFKLNLGIRAGISIIKEQTFLLPSSCLQPYILVYRNVIQNKAPFTVNMGVAAHYFFAQHWAVGLMADYHHFNLKVNNRDDRRGINNILLVKQKKDFLNLGLGLTYKFLKVKR